MEADDPLVEMTQLKGAVKRRSRSQSCWHLSHMQGSLWSMTQVVMALVA